MESTNYSMKVHDYFSDEESDLIELSEEELTDIIKKTKLLAWEENKEVFINLMIYCPFFITCCVKMPHL